VDAERRQITVLFADVVGFTTFSERSGEEAAFTLMRQLAKLTDETALNIKGCVLILLRRTDEGLALLETFRRRCFADGDLYSLTTSDAFLGVAKVIQGNIGEGIRLLEQQYRSGRARVIGRLRIGIACSSARCTYKSLREMKSSHSRPC